MQIPDWIQQVLLTGSGAAVVAFGLFTFLGKNWIRNQLDKNLERAKSEISLQSTQRMRLRDKEYEVFPELWSFLIEAHDSLSVSLGALRSVPDFQRMERGELNEWLVESDLDTSEKNYLLEETNKNAAYCRILDVRELSAAQVSIYNFGNYLHKNRIFLSPEIKEKFDQIQIKLRESWAARRVDFDLRGEPTDTDFLGKAHKIFNKEIKPLMEDIEQIVQQKLFPEK